MRVTCRRHCCPPQGGSCCNRGVEEAPEHLELVERNVSGAAEASPLNDGGGGKDK